MARKIVGVAAAAVTLLLGACTGGSDPVPDPVPVTGPPSFSSTLSPPPAPAAPTAPAAARKPTPRGAVAFFRYFWDVYNYSFATLSTETLRQISDSTCKFCSGAVAGIEKRRAESGRFEGGVVTVKTAVAAKDDVKVGLLINSVLDQSKSRTLGHDGSEIQTVPGTRGMRIDAAVRWKSDHWSVIAVDALPKGGS